MLNSLSLDFIAVSAALLAEGGYFEEIGKRGVWSEARMGAAGPAAYDALALDRELIAIPQWVQRTLVLLTARVGRGAVRRLPLHVFELAQQWQAAFRLLQSGGNTGKVVLRLYAAEAESQMQMK